MALGCRGLSGLPWVEWVVNGGCGFVGRQWKRTGFVSVKRRIRKVGGRKEKKKMGWR